MSQSREEDPKEITHEDVIDGIIVLLQEAGACPGNSRPVDWDVFLRLSELVHRTYEVPSTTFTPLMRRLLFALGAVTTPDYVVGVGTYVGYTFSWLLRDRSDREGGPFVKRAVGIDINKEANAVARQNCSALGHRDRLSFVGSDGASALNRFNGSVDLLYIDLDNEIKGKSEYRNVLEAAMPHLRPHAMILAHDPCVEAFSEDFERYHNFIRESGKFHGAWVFPVDACGLSVAVLH